MFHVPKNSSCILTRLALLPQNVGKSIQSLAAIGMLMRGGVIKNALIISPKTVAYNWKKEANKWLPKINVANLQIDLVTSDTKPNDKRKILRAALGASRNER
mmetsp:Transcript_32252/g.67246  ORF Transcript_32252/g.67246 Transcript_32252/m.67246 type:complete len:102 (+) Transcript_32252:4279-4584(+)